MVNYGDPLPYPKHQQDEKMKAGEATLQPPFIDAARKQTYITMLFEDIGFDQMTFLVRGACLSPSN